ncbi:hypothetical protein CFAM422_007148 [Trichoderma lentiforme]|uniref:Uncharacterized protein n=1 Tax=Trichoderma lentiforme TaxID=1567552 RepID=A0A9P5CAJ0_9HYPO|nr:hypothetical protein CFAM422_007148 [Trichoderma lentiforme]
MQSPAEDKGKKTTRPHDGGKAKLPEHRLPKNPHGVCIGSVSRAGHCMLGAVALFCVAER